MVDPAGLGVRGVLRLGPDDRLVQRELRAVLGRAADGLQRGHEGARPARDELRCALRSPVDMTEEPLGGGSGGGEASRPVDG